MNKERKSRLTLWIFISIIAAVITALAVPQFAMKLHVGGEVFLRLLKMMVVPLVVASVMSGILGLGDVRRLGRPGGYAILYYLSTTVIAVIIGLFVMNIIQPGVGTVDEATLTEIRESSEITSAKSKVLDTLADATGLTESEIGSVFKELPSGEHETPTISTIFKNLFLMLFTDNLFDSAVKTNLLPLIVFSIIFAAMLTTMGTKVDNLTSMITQVADALMSFIMLLMKVAPLGIFCLVAARFGEAHAEGKFLEVLNQTGLYFVTILIGLLIHAFLILALIYWIFTKKNPFRFMYQMSSALLTAFSTASSAATLPVTMDCAINKAGISKRSTKFVMPIGATINMDGTALYEAGAALFIAQAIGIGLDPIEQIIVAITATLAAIGAASIPEAGLVTMVIVLNAVDLPVEYIGLILTVDWLLDRFRTTINVFGDSVGAAIIDKAFKVQTQPD